MKGNKDNEADDGTANIECNAQWETQCFMGLMPDLYWSSDTPIYTCFLIVQSSLQSIFNE